MELTLLSTFAVALRIFPDRSQFFQYDSFTLSCGEHKNTSGWTIRRNTSKNKNEECSISWGKRNESHCSLHDPYQSDSGEYWCEYEDGMCSEVVNITVTGGSVILDIPVHPLQEGDALTLRCTNKTTSFSNHMAGFYKDGQLIGKSSAGIMTIPKVLKSDEGFYKCKIFSTGESPDSWVAVRAGRSKSVHTPLVYVLLAVMGICLLLAFVILLLCLWRKHKGEIGSDVSYTDVTITKEMQPETDKERDSESTFYSTIQPWAS